MNHENVCKAANKACKGRGQSLTMGLFLILVMAVSLVLGTADVSWKEILGVVSDSAPLESSSKLIVFKIRLPRIILAGLVGFALSVGVITAFMGAPFFIYLLKRRGSQWSRS